MKTVAIFATVLPILSAFAAPVPENDGKGKKSHDSGKGVYKPNSQYISNGVFDFTSTYSTYATPDQVVNANSTPTPGEPGAYGWFNYGINARQEIICYNITVFVSGNYSSPAKTATHIHQAVYGRNGPPRIAFPNPTITSPIDEFGRRVSIGCLQGPFTTGLAANGTDTGTNFTLAQIEQNPPGFFTDTHTASYLAGAIRGQLTLTGTSY
ncbi:BZ3500_MvSof-1268-A1-R1_Chr9g10698 [Microbotryum saponariae]|uniref:BZ3500_MvSof-1268-A1-R1_Chr9g10698 protein n=1 Tax=Microbotryum saponariae TaxID=289078 RepID=A0A2X0LN76_9BASI|nr:BZ3501_MvSof-1269-A2-R1_Chr9g10446 [Microbotryum saponariae]SDA00543.1 BZ3500_MvSof-1268-A1-R1_Chr9g10698 [Microbotryum saponariae]